MGSATRAALEAAKQRSRLGEGRDARRPASSCSRPAATSRAPRSCAPLLADPSVERGREAGADRRASSAASTPPPRRCSARSSASRWSNSDELLDGIEEIGIRAIAARPRDDAGIEAELFAFARAVSSDAELELAVGSKLGDAGRRRSRSSTRLLGGQGDAGTLAIVRHLVQSPRGRRIGELLARPPRSSRTPRRLRRDRHGRRAARPPRSSTRLAATLATQYGREPRIDRRHRPVVIGGLRVQIGDDVIDGSIASRLTELRLQLAG